MRTALVLVPCLVLAATVSAADPVAVNPTGDAEASVLAVSGTGNASGERACVPVGSYLHCTAPVAVSAGGDADGAVAASGLGDADGIVALSGTGDAASCKLFVYCFAWSALGTCNGLACAAAKKGDVVADRLAVSLYGSATCGGSDGCVAVSPSQQAQGTIAAAANGDATVDGSICLVVACVGGLAVTGTGTADGCSMGSCGFAASGLGDANGGFVAASGAGDVGGTTLVAVAGGSATGSLAVAVLGDASSRSVTYLGTANVAGPAVSLFGNATSSCAGPPGTTCDYGIAASGTGEARCERTTTCVAVSGI